MAVAAPDQARAEVEQLKACNNQLLSATSQEAADTGMADLQRQLEHANQQLASQGSASSTRALAERCKELEENLQLSNQRLRETCEASGLTQMQSRLDIMAWERNMALNRVQDMLEKGRTLEAQYKELQVQLATTKAELESQLRVANIELESKQRQFESEAEFARDQKAEVDRLKADLKEVWDELKTKKAELGTLQAQAPPVQTMAQYQTMPPGQFQGSPLQTGTRDIIAQR